MVRASGARPSLAADARPVRDPRLGGDAPADAGRAGRPAVRALARAVADGRGARSRLTRRRDRRMAGARLQPTRTRAAPRRGLRRRARLAGRADGATRRRAVHGCRAQELRLRRGRPAARRQRRARRAPHGARVHRRGGAGTHGSRRDRLSRADPALPVVPSGGRRVLRAEPGTSPRGSSRASRAPFDSAAPRCCVSSRPRHVPRRSSKPTPSSHSSATGSSSSSGESFICLRDPFELATVSCKPEAGSAREPGRCPADGARARGRAPRRAPARSGSSGST